MCESRGKKDDICRDGLVTPKASRVHGGDCRVDNVANVVARKDKHLVRQAAFPVKLAAIIVLVLFMNVKIHARDREVRGEIWCELADNV